MLDNGQQKEDKRQISIRDHSSMGEDFVLERSIFSNIFEKDIRRVYIYKKAERLAKALHLVAPAFARSTALRDRLDCVAVGLIDAAILPPLSAKDALARELLALSSLLSLARTGGILSPMNADLISREAHLLLQEVAAYEEPQLFFDDAPSLASLAKSAGHSSSKEARKPRAIYKGHISDIKMSDRREAILGVLRSKDRTFIRDISSIIRGVSEKTIQRELQALLVEGVIKKEGERRWTTYALA